MDFGVAPAVQAAIKRLVDEQDYGYADREGGFPERAVAFAFSRHQKELYGWEPDPDLVVPLPDLVQAMLATIVAFTEPSDGVILQLPAYPPFISTIEASGRKLIANPMIDDGNGWCLDLARLEADAPSARLLMVCNPQNPTGRVLTRVELSALGRVAIDHDLVIVCDEVHAELTYAGSAHLPMALVSPEIAARTVTITSATKSFNIAGLRCAVMHFGSPKLFDRFRKRIPDGLLGHLSVVGVDATIAAWADGAQWLQSTLGHLDANRAHLGDFVAQRKYIGYHEPQATYLAWLDLTNLNLEPSPWEFLKQTANIVTTAGWEFGQDYGQFVRLNFATPSAVLEEILSRMAAAIG
jgi:cysteine-S-conjugate beta-lyase